MRKSAVYPVLCAVSACMFLFSSGMTFASWKVQNDTVNKINMASVSGQIVEEYQQNQVVYPNETVNKIVQVKNTGTVEALPRVKIEKVWGDGRDENGKLLINPDLSTDNIEITYNTEKWIYNSSDGYFYYSEVLNPNDTTSSLFDSFTINGEITGGEYKNKQADIIVNMEMIQAAGNSLSYWNTSFEELGIVYEQTEQSEIVTAVDFNSPEKGFTFDINNGDLFADFKNLVPGETRSQVVRITNKWNNDAEFFLWADFIDQSHATGRTQELIYKLLHEYAEIVITDDNGNMIYSGAIWGNADIDSTGTDSMKYPYSLGIFTDGETKNLNISLHLDSKMDNEQLELLGLIKWVFSAEGSDYGVLADSSEPEEFDEGNTPPDSSSRSNTEYPSNSNPSTGDSFKIGVYAFISAMAFIMIPITYKKSKK